MDRVEYYDEIMLRWSKTRPMTDGEAVNHRINKWRKRKEALGHRIQVLRVLLRRYYADERDSCMEDDFCKYVESVLDNLLVKYDFDLEKIIDLARDNAPPIKEFPLFCEVCGYRPVFCQCGGEATSAPPAKNVQVSLL